MSRPAGIAEAVRRVLDIESGKRRPEGLTAAQIAERCRVTRLAPEATGADVADAIVDLMESGYDIQRETYTEYGVGRYALAVK